MGDENTLMDDLAAAWDEAEGVEQPEEPVGGAPEEVTEQVAESAPEASTDGGDDDSPIPTSAEPPEASADTPEVDSATPIDTTEPPRGLSPAAREVWKDVPEAVKAEYAKRERDFEQGIQKYAENAKRADAMDRTLAPYQNLFAMNGGPGNVLPGLLQTAAQLQMGSTEAKAQAAAQIIQQFGVDVQTLDTILSGQPRQQAPQQEDIQQLVSQQVQQAVQPYLQSQQQQRNNELQGQIQQFAAQNEFYNDVRQDMADIMDVAAKQGRDMTLQQAYDRALMMRDDIRAILDARKQSESLQDKQNAASSVAGTPTGADVAPEPQTMADYLSRAWDSVDNASRR